jgi:hypothetical protein
MWYLLLGTVLTVLSIGAWIVISAIGVVIATISLGSAVAMLVGLIATEWWNSRE